MKQIYKEKMGVRPGHTMLSRFGIMLWRQMCTMTSTVTVKREKEGTVLFRRLTALGFRNTKIKVADVLDKWQKEGRSLSRPQLLSYVTELRRYKMPHIAIQLYQWMEEKKRTMKNSDRAIFIDLLAKTKGITSAEEHFNSLAQSAQTKKTYGALLKCYCSGQMVEKATELFQKMTELNFHGAALNYNNMMALYMKVGMPERVPLLVQEMEEKNIAPDLYSYNQLMNSYAALQDIEAVEGVLRTMKSKKVKYDWLTLGNLATMYFNAGFKDKANDALKELEKMQSPKDPEAMHTLLNLYSRMSNAAGVIRAWEHCKSKIPKPSNTTYLLMHLALSRLGDFDGLEKLFREWESVCSYYDVRICNVLLESYLKRDMIEEASLLYDSIIGRGVNPNLRTHDAYMNICLRKRQIDFALQCFEAVASKMTPEQNNWFPPQESVNAFLKYFEEEKDANAESKFHMIMKKINSCDVETEKIPSVETKMIPSVSDVETKKIPIVSSPSLFNKLVTQFHSSRL